MMEEQNELREMVADLVEALSFASKAEHAQCLTEATKLSSSLQVNSAERLTWRNVARLLRAERRRFSK